MIVVVVVVVVGHGYLTLFCLQLLQTANLCTKVVSMSSLAITHRFFRFSTLTQRCIRAQHVEGRGLSFENEAKCYDTLQITFTESKMKSESYSLSRGE